MSVTTPSLAVGRSASLRRTTVTAGLTAAVATTTVAATVHAAGIPLSVDGEMIPLAGFAQMTLLGAVVGGVLVAMFNRRSSAPSRRFIQVAAALTALSCLPSVALPPDAATKIALVVTHLVAAAIVVPALVRHAR